MPSKSKREKQAGIFAIAPGREVYGELTIFGPKTSLQLRDEEFFPTHTIPDLCVKGVLHDLTKVSLVNCITPRVPGSTTGPKGSYYTAKIFPHFVISGDHHIDPTEPVIREAAFVIDDGKPLFYDFDAYGCVLFDAQPFVEQIVRAQPHDRPVSTGPNARILYYTGKDEIASADTIIGKVHIRHRPGFPIDGSKGGLLKERIVVSIEFRDNLIFSEAIDRVSKLTEYLGMLVGRPQNLLALYVGIGTSSNACERHKVDWSMAPERNTFSESAKPSPCDVLIDAVRHSDEFSTILKNWMLRQEDWHGARWRFFNSFAKQRHYDVDRLIASANMFDILPPSAIPQDVQLSADMISSHSTCRRIFKELPQSAERDSLLGALGRLGKCSLKHKVRHRAQMLIDLSGDRFQNLLKVTDEAVDCRNYYVHGTEGRFEYDLHFDTVVFFTDTLEFVFAISDLIEAGWKFEDWLKAATSMSHPFGRYKVNYRANFSALNALLPNEATPLN